MKRCLFFLLCIVLFAACSGGSKSDERKRPPFPVRTFTVKAAAFTRVLEATGEVEALQRAIVSSTTDGRIQCCLWVEGTSVKAGQILYQIERDAARREIDIARQAYYAAAARTADLQAGFRPEEIKKIEQDAASAREQLAFQEKNYQRLEKLMETGSVSQESLEKAKVELINARSRMEIAANQLQIAKTGPTRTQVAVAEAAEREAWAKLQQAKSKYAENQVDAPFAGVITRVVARPGDTVSARSELLEIADPENLVIRFSVPERMALQVRQEAPTQLLFDAYPGRVFPGKVVRLFPVIDEKTRVLWAHAKLDEPTRLLPGMFARIEVILDEHPDSLTVPESAVVQAPDGSAHVFLVQGKKAKKTPVKIAGASRGFVRVIEGLGAGDVVVANDADQLYDGQDVVPLDAGQKPREKKEGKTGKPQAASPMDFPVPAGESPMISPSSAGK